MYLSANASRNTCLPSSDVKLMRCSGRGLLKYEGAGVGAGSCFGNGGSNVFVGIETGGAAEDDEVEVEEDGKDELKNLHCCWMILGRLPFTWKALVDGASETQKIEECWSWFAKLNSTTRGHNVLQPFVSIFSPHRKPKSEKKKKTGDEKMRSEMRPKDEGEQRLFS